MGCNNSRVAPEAKSEAEAAAEAAIPENRLRAETPAAFYSPAGGRANSLADAAMRLEPNRLRRGDPAAFPEKIVESFWQRLVEATPGLADAWDASKKDEL